MSTVIAYAINAESDGVAIKRIVANVVQTQQDVARAYSHLIALRDSGAGNNWAAISAAIGTADDTDAGAVFNKIVTLYGNMNTASTTCAVLDELRPV